MKRRDAVSVGFPPIADADARVLVLGSLPGRMSLEKQQYYAQPYNAFWKIMGQLFGAAPELPYERRLEELRKHGVAVWDVLAAGERSGSLDSAIVAASRTPVSAMIRTVFASSAPNGEPPAAWRTR